LSIELLVTSIGTWAVALFSARVALLGNPLLNLVAHQEADLLGRADELTKGEHHPEPGPETELIRRFSRVVLLELVMLALEVAMLVMFLLEGQLPLLCWLLLGKNLLLLAASLWASRCLNTDGVFSGILSIPSWMVWTDRISAALTAAGFAVLLLHINALLG